jgi:hypothetical protein
MFVLLVLLITFEICTVHLTGYQVRKLLNSILDHSTETASDDDTLDVSDDDFFMSGSSSDEEADDEWTDKSAKYDSQTTALGHCSCNMLLCYHLFMRSSKSNKIN